jgi:dUTPase
MYLYIYDRCTSAKKNLKTLGEVKKKLTDLGLNGKILKLKEVKKVESEIKKELKKGYKTIIVVGSDATVNMVINAITSTGLTGIDYKPSLGIIPLNNKNNKIAEALGIKNPHEACDIILARRFVQITLGKINDLYFLSEINAKNGDDQLEINKNYSIKVTRPSIIHIINFSSGISADPRDNRLDLYIYTKKRGPGILFKKNHTDQSYFPLKELTIKNKKTSLFIDHSLALKAPATISTSEQKINIIVGKNRNF